MRSIPLILALCLLAACDSASEPPPEAQPTQGVEAKEGVAITDARIVLPLVEGRPGAAYMTVANNSASATDIAAIYVEGAERTELHESAMAGGRMTMEPVAAITVPAAGSVELKQGGLHAMVFGLSPDFAGDSVEVTVTFGNGDKTSLDARVSRMGKDDPAGSDN